MTGECRSKWKPLCWSTLPLRSARSQTLPQTTASQLKRRGQLHQRLLTQCVVYVLFPPQQSLIWWGMRANKYCHCARWRASSGLACCSHHLLHISRVHRNNR
jgi:hypothetical protein